MTLYSGDRMSSESPALDTNVADKEENGIDTHRIRERARAQAKRGDVAGARRALEKAIGSIEDELERAKLEADLAELKKESQGIATAEIRLEDVTPADEDGIVGRGAAMQRLRRSIVKAAGSNAPLLIEGESGTGKELVARAVHRRSGRGDRPFVAVNAAALAPGVVEAELFGHAAGAFTGATSAREGLIATAKGGTLLFDCIEEMPLEIQAKLLRVLEEGEVRPVGGGEAVKVDARIIATSRRALGPLARGGAFRSDLLYRLNVLTISVPPLRERVEDMTSLVDHLLRRHATGGRIPRLTPEALELLKSYSFPGNVRELENELRRLLVVGVDPIDAASLGSAIRSGKPSTQDELSTGLYERLRGKTLDDIERSAILSALRAAGGNRSQAARMLKVSRRALYDKIKRYGIDK